MDDKIEENDVPATQTIERGVCTTREIGVLEMRYTGRWKFIRIYQSIDFGYGELFINPKYIVTF